MNAINYIKKKIIRLQNSSKVLKLNYYFHKYFKDQKLGSLGLDFTNKPNRQHVVQNIIDKKKYNSYLEIGCFDDELFNFIKCKKKVGVDPVSGGTVRKTSDQFFKDNNEKFDCIFIDGLHYYSQVKKDIENSLQVLNQNGIILLHDCLPNNYYDQAIPRCQYTWNGDVWRAIVECRTNEKIDTYTCYSDFGIGVIFNRKNRNVLNISTNNFSKISFEDYFRNYKKYMNIIEYDDLIKIM